MLTTWKRILTHAMAANKETMADIVDSTLTEKQLDEQFDSGYGCAEGCEFTVWTMDYVYFPACYDGAEWVASVARNPNGEPTEHIGGG